MKLMVLASRSRLMNGSQVHKPSLSSSCLWKLEEKKSTISNLVFQLGCIKLQMLIPTLDTSRLLLLALYLPPSSISTLDGGPDVDGEDGARQCCACMRWSRSDLVLWVYGDGSGWRWWSGALLAWEDGVEDECEKEGALNSGFWWGGEEREK